jgi:hypothetical protein
MLQRRFHEDPRFVIEHIKQQDAMVITTAGGNQVGTSINSAEHRAGRLSGRYDASDAAVAAGSGRF